MAVQQLITGSPLRTLYLLIAGKPNDAFTNSNSNFSVPGVPDGILPSNQVISCALTHRYKYSDIYRTVSF